MLLTPDNTLPLPTEVEGDFLAHATDMRSACAWLIALDVDPQPIINSVGRIALIETAFVWSPYADRYEFKVYDPEHIGPKYPPSLAVPIIEVGTFVDLLLIYSNSFEFTTACGRASWLGRDDIGRGNTLRLHKHPMDWLAAGCRGACHIAPISRSAFNDLNQVRYIQCNDIRTALEAFDWSCSNDDDEVAGRWIIDDEPDNILAYFNKLADIRVRHALRRERNDAAAGRRTAGRLPQTAHDKSHTT
jgi:hypothetical protein